MCTDYFTLLQFCCAQSLALSVLNPFNNFMRGHFIILHRWAEYSASADEETEAQDSAGTWLKCQTMPGRGGIHTPALRLQESLSVARINQPKVHRGINLLALILISSTFSSTVRWFISMRVTGKTPRILNLPVWPLGSCFYLQQCDKPRSRCLVKSKNLKELELYSLQGSGRWPKWGK